MQVQMMQGTPEIPQESPIITNYISDLKTNYEKRIVELQTQYEQQELQIHKFKNDAIYYENKYLEIKERYDLLIYKRFMRSAEQLPVDDKQKMLFSGEAEPVEIPAEEETEVKTEVKSYTRNKPGRKPIDPKIPREIVILDIPEEDKTCACGAKLTKIGEDISEKVELIPPSMKVKQFHRLKYACRSCEGTESEGITPTVRIAPVEPSIIPRSISTPSLLSTIFTHKFEDHLPYYRQEKQFERIGIDISRQDMSNWQQHVYNKLTPLYVLLKEKVKSGPVIQMDETSMEVLSGIKTKKEDKIPGEHKLDIHTGWMWLARGGPPGEKVVWYEYHESHAGKHAKEFLEGYKGYLQTDGLEAYDYAVKDNPDIIHVGCFAHSRRKFFEASKASKNNKSAEEGMKYIRKLYDIENALRAEKLNENEFLEKRKNQILPIFEEFKSWLLKRADEVPPTNLMGTAINYTLKQWDKMTAYHKSYHLTPDNNACENAIRPFVIGRKNWLMSGSPIGAKSSCGIYSLIETAKQNSLVPFYYLMALFEKAPNASTPEHWENLLPWNIFKE